MKSTILITGVSSGIGQYLSKKLINQGHNIIGIDNIKKNILIHKNYQFYKCDLANKIKVNNVCKKIILKNEINIIINCASILIDQPMLSIQNFKIKLHSVEDFEKVMRNNLFSVFYITRNLIKHLIGSKNKNKLIINFSSISSKGNIGQSAYSASKAGIEALTTTWSKELSNFGVRVVSISPGIIDTPMPRRSFSEKEMDHYKSINPMKRLGKPQDIYLAVKFIIQNSYVNNTNLEVSGGFNF